jgi:hypothetical protein
MHNFPLFSMSSSEQQKLPKRHSTLLRYAVVAGACGTAAFLLAAYAYQRTNRRQRCAAGPDTSESEHSDSLLTATIAAPTMEELSSPPTQRTSPSARARALGCSDKATSTDGPALKSSGPAARRVGSSNARFSSRHQQPLHKGSPEQCRTSKPSPPPIDPVQLEGVEYVDEWLTGSDTATQPCGAADSDRGAFNESDNEHSPQVFRLTKRHSAVIEKLASRSPSQRWTPRGLVEDF